MEYQKKPNLLQGGGGKPRVSLIVQEIAGLPGKAAWFFFKKPQMGTGGH
jgi:hypothetical protein